MPSIESSRQAAQDAIKNGQLVRASTPAVNPAPPTPPLTDTNSLNRFLDSPLPANYTQQPDQQRQWQRGGVVPQERVPPLPPAANAQIGATSQSQAVIVVAQTPPSTGTGGGITSASLTVPSFLTVTGSPITPPSGAFAVGLATENPGTYFSVPSANLPSLENSTTGSLGEGPTGSGTLSLSLSPTSATSWAIYAAGYNGTLTTPSGFTAYGGATSHDAAYFNSLSGTSPVTIAQAVASNSTASAVFAIFAGSLPSIVQQTSATFVGVTPLTKAFTGVNTAGNTIILVVSTINNTNGPFSLNVSDSNGNTYTTIGYVQGSGVWQPSVLLAIATNIAGGANTVSASITGTPAGGSAGILQLVEYPALTAASAIPVFKNILPGDLPPINLQSAGNGGVSGILKPVNGGTGSDLSATGGASQVLKQTSAGANITVAQLAASDLSNGTTGTTTVVLSASPTLTGTLAAGSETLTGKITNYNGIATVSNGIPAEYATIDLPAQAANIGATPLYAVPASGVGVYRVSSYIVMTTPASLTSTLPTVQIVYTDNDSNTSVTMDATPVSASAGLGQTGALNVNAAGSAASGVIAVYVKASTTIQYQTINYASNAAGMQYALRIKLEALG